jgi:peroxiredoxin
MKYLFFLLLISSQLKSQNNFEVHGKIIENEPEKIVATYLDGNNKMINDTLEVKQSKFKIAGNIDQYSNLSIVYNNNIISFIINRGITNVTIEGNKIININGNGAITEKNKLKSPRYSAIKNTENEIFSLQNQYLKVYSKDSIKAKRIATQGQILQTKLLDEYKQFIKETPNSYQSLEYLRILSPQISFDDYEHLFKSLSSQVKDNLLGNKISTEIRNKKNNSKGKVIEDFEKKDINDNTIKLSNFRDKKSVLLIFWASWCAPCIEELKILKKENIKPELLEIILISTLDKKESWKAAIEKYSLQEYINISDSNPPQDLYQKYSIPFIPTSFLINKEGIIIGRYEGLQTDQVLKDIYTTISN